MVRQSIYDDRLYAHFVTFSCWHRRRLLDHDRCKRIVLGVLNSELSRKQAKCVGFVIMPDHVHAILWFSRVRQLSHFMKQWKQRSSVRIRTFFEQTAERYGEMIEAGHVWQRRYYAFQIETDRKLEEKLEYMHLNPVRGGLVDRVVDWPWSSARWYEDRSSVGVPIEWVD